MKVSDYATLMGNQGKKRVKTFTSKSELAMTRRITHVRILVGCMKYLNEFSEADLILVDIVREVHILKERISDAAAGTLAMPVWWREDE